MLDFTIVFLYFFGYMNEFQIKSYVGTNLQDMKAKVRTMPPSCDITEDDVELLPWILGGLATDVKKMTKLFTEDFEEILQKVVDPEEAEEFEKRTTARPLL